MEIFRRRRRLKINCHNLLEKKGGIEKTVFWQNAMYDECHFEMNFASTSVHLTRATLTHIIYIHNKIPTVDNYFNIYFLWSASHSKIPECNFNE